MGDPETKISGHPQQEHEPTETEISAAMEHFHRQMLPFYEAVRDMKGLIHDAFFTIKGILTQAEDRLRLGNHRDWDDSLHMIQAVINFESSGRSSKQENKTTDGNEGMVAELVDSVLPEATAIKDVAHSAFLRRLALQHSYWSDDDVIEQMEIRLILVREILKSRGDPGNNQTLQEISQALSTVLDDVATARSRNSTKMPLQVSALLTKLGYY